MSPPTRHRVPEPERLRRWRLVLGHGPDHSADGTGVTLTGADVGLDAALAALYDAPPRDRSGGRGRHRAGGLGASAPRVARWLGDVPAHALGEVVRGVSAWLGRAGAALRMNTAEYLQEESCALPAPLEAQAFYSDVERLRDDVERLAARLARLERNR